jgi:ABC-type transport system involved in multi-copper enzyme maturation permease subunit
MIGLLLKDLYMMRQYGKTMGVMLLMFAVISAGLDNPATFFEGFFILMSMMLTITSFSYDALAKWDRYALSLPVTRKEIVGEKYLLSLVLCMGSAVISFLIAFVVLKFSPVDGFGLKEQFIATIAIICAALFFAGILLPLTFKFGVEKGRLLMIAIFAVIPAAVIALNKAGVSTPSQSSIFAFLKLLPAVMIVLYILSYLLSVKIYSRKEI